MFSHLRWYMFALLLTLSSAMAAQTRKGSITYSKNADDHCGYFKDNISLLDPIEGIWSVEAVKQGWNNYIKYTDETQNYHLTIVKSGDEYKNLVPNGSQPDIILRRIGETNVYNCKFRQGTPQGFTWVSQRVVLENGVLFSITYNMPILNAVGETGRITYTYIKEYPTASMYAEAATEKRQEEKVGDWGGTGFALNNGYVATNYHVVEGAASIKISGVQGNFSTSYSANVVASDKFNDLAILKINDPAFKGFGTIPYKVKTTLDEVGEDIFVLGYPLTATMGEEIKLTTGIISARTGFQGDVSLYQISAPVQPGNSGGPLFDSKGDLIGIVNAKHTEAENVGYAIKTSYLQNLMATSLSSNILPTSNTISALSLSEKVKRLKNFTFMITCSSQASNTSHDPSNDNTTPTISPKIPTSGTHVRTIVNPTVDDNNAIWTTTIDKVILNSSYTAVQFTWKNPAETDGERWFWIYGDTYILVNARRYSLIYAEGIDIRSDNAPHRYFSSKKGEELTFTLYFPAIPPSATTMDLIEYNGKERTHKRFYGININTQTDNSSQSTQVISEPTGHINGYGYVDLGLSVKWATCNVGASSPYDYGNKYAWGETEAKSSYTRMNSVTYGKEIKEGEIAGKPKYDVARAKMGGTWRLPTKTEMYELQNRCKWVKIILNGCNGFKITGPNGNSIFLPANNTSGSYWSATPDAWDSCKSYRFCFLLAFELTLTSGDRNIPSAIRPVSE